ncbi:MULTISPECIES: acyl-CoA dehydrogenase family protein [unclassified Rhodococcus (in: high G+C Gram-positive bacteria)]|uniref:acyl-CoA dehydrogenase family protein n=1 Tax=unclassified Rhodococcus (in: high G+C Gram-positive bacteria) TaxID=192944 RepID=UPI00163B2B29|nr:MULTISPECIES: acyl-CoA dehydrogenase [unclassified Rhodococcus (in: high G+C Gram-positive bacteria)]MBC2640757.1 acyl-CoA dehydrogenase [Rhodococcus sp. 3A]MBC2894498.1 acyl-CoA dehydrogenase [Rhodococcus sp. 4CII]
MANSTDTFADTVDEFLRRNYSDDVRRQLLSTHDSSSALAASFAELGVFAVALTEEQGGLGMSLATLGPLFTQYGRHLVAGPMLENSLIPALLYAAMPEEGQKLLSNAIENGAVLAIADPGVSVHWREQLGSITTDGASLCGRFDVVRFAPDASVLVVVAHNHDRPELWLVEAGAPGVGIEPVESSDPLASFARVTLDGVIGIPVTDQSTVPNLLRQIRLWSQALIACELSGIANRCVELSLTYALQREQFGRPIGSFQAIKHILADMHTRAAALTNMCEATMERLAEDDALGAELDCAALKAYAATVGVSVCEDAIQVHGGIGFTAEADIHWYYKRVLALRAWYGDTTELAELIGSIALQPATPTTMRS